MDMKFRSEKISDVLEEAKPLLQLHYEELAHYTDIPLDPDYDTYLKLESIGVTRGYTARDDNKALVGYALFIVKPHIHYRSMLLAQCDIIYIHPDRRGVGYYFIKYCDEMLKDEGVTVVSHHIKAKKNWGPMIERIGYSLMDQIFVKRLN